MPTIEFTVNILVLAAMLIGSLLVGLGIRSRQVMKGRLRIEELENEMLSNYAEILDLQKEHAAMESKLRDFEIPVIPIKTVVKEGLEENDKFQDVSLRKKLLSKDNILHSSVASK